MTASLLQCQSTSISNTACAEKQTYLLTGNVTDNFTNNLNNSFQLIQQRTAKDTTARCHIPLYLNTAQRLNNLIESQLDNKSTRRAI